MAITFNKELPVAGSTTPEGLEANQRAESFMALLVEVMPHDVDTDVSTTLPTKNIGEKPGIRSAS